MSNVSHDSETPAVGQQVITAVALIHRQREGVREVFMPKRAATKKFLPDVYELPGGHIDFGEDIVEGLKREIREELGMTITVGEPFAAFTYTNEVKGSHSIEVVYFATFTESDDQIRIDPDDHSTFGWFSLQTLDQAHSPQKGADDIEIINVRRGLELLDGAALNAG